ncbi:cobyric acid synthase [Natronomonas marina]|jgi:adenosylcobyric acid synthase|uniref:cobyric acid synthase n=1 Tax=Natronomonas marina TaxID=2961939 RepID=UPI0020CA11BD|nr:cobyric acid synthase [Natronomonas marina]
MTRTVLVAGTASHVGKSTVVAGLCRRLSREGVAVAPFKAQNMSNNARAVVTPDGNWGEIGVSQFVQARAANVAPTTDMNPVLLKPRGEGESQLVIQGEAVGHYEPGEYYDEHWAQARQAAIESYERLAAEYDLIVAEGAGSIAEINLHDCDLANVETARFADASIVLLGDIERGGVFASLYGTLELMPEDLRDRVRGVVITKFRGDASLLDPGIEELEAKMGTPVLGVLPYDDPGLPEEDSVSLPSEGQRAVFGDDDGHPPEQTVTIGVPRLPRISNFTDLAPLAAVPGVRVEYVPIDSQLADLDAVILPGTKNTVDDLLALKEAGLDDALSSFSGPIVGICGGYQMLGERITNASIEGTGTADVIDGIGLLPVETCFSHQKRVQQVSLEATGTGPIDGVAGTISGYEIHMGRATYTGAVKQPLEEQSAATQSVLGTYLHGLFENEDVRDAFLDSVFRHANKQRDVTDMEQRSSYDSAAELVDEFDYSVFTRCL